MSGRAPGLPAAASVSRSHLRGGQQESSEGREGIEYCRERNATFSPDCGGSPSTCETAS